LNLDPYTWSKASLREKVFYHLIRSTSPKSNL
jgi:hypothetical protein